MIVQVNKKTSKNSKSNVWEHFFSSWAEEKTHEMNPRSVHHWKNGVEHWGMCLKSQLTGG